MTPSPHLAREAAASTGYVGESTWQHALAAGWQPAELSEVFAHIIANVFTNYFNHYARTELDLPPAPTSWTVTPTRDQVPTRIRYRHNAEPMTMQAIFNGVVIAESDDTVVEGNHYFPEESLNWQFFTQGSRHEVQGSRPRADDRRLSHVPPRDPGRPATPATATMTAWPQSSR